jgi:U3 small nucleolar RNA-associated protein 12
VHCRHSDGSVRIWSLSRKALVTRLQGHKRAVTCVCFGEDGDTVVSGSQDTSIVVWDLTTQSGVCRLRGHRDEVTAVALSPDGGRLVSASKDTLVKVWDLTTQSCVQTVVGHRTEVWGMCLMPAVGACPAGEDASTADNGLRGVKRSREESPQVAFSQDTAPFRVLTGGGDAMLRCFAMNTAEQAESVAESVAERVGGDQVIPPQHLQAMGSVARVDSSKCQGLCVDPSRQWVGVYGSGKTVELYRAREWSEVRRRIQRRRKRAKEKSDRAAAKAEDEEVEGGEKRVKGAIGSSAFEAAAEEEMPESNVIQPIAGDEWELVAIVRCSHKLRSAALLPSSAVPTAVAEEGNSTPAVLLCTADNQIELHCVDREESKSTTLPDGSKVAGSRRVGAISRDGHRKDVRAVSIGPDNNMLLSASDGVLKLWNTHTGESLRTMECGFALCCEFLPGGQHAVVGTKEGGLQVFDLASGDLVEEHADAHEGAVYSIDVRADGRGVASGSADKSVKLWELDAVAVSDGSSDVRPTLVHSRTLRMPDEVLAVRYSRHGATDGSRRLLAVSLLDSTIKVFFEDSLKFFLSLFGHRLPVTSIDISADSTLIATASADKNVKIWGLDFGDCHKSLFAHDDAVTCVRFVGRTHLMFTSGRDGLVRQWDADSFSQVHDCKGHSGAVWGLAVSRNGLTVASVGADRSVRVFRRSEEQVFLDEEREAEAETSLEKELASKADTHDPFGEGLVGPSSEGAPGTVEAPEATAVGGGSRESVRAADKLLEAMSLARETREAWDDHERDLEQAVRDMPSESRTERILSRRAGERLKPLVAPPAPKIELLKRTPSEHVLATLRSIAPGDREQAMLLLPLSGALELLSYLHLHIANGTDVELSVRSALFLVRLHYPQIVSSSHEMRSRLAHLREVIHARVGSLRKLVGVNQAGLRFLDHAAASISSTGQGGFLSASTEADPSSSSSSSRGIRVNRMRDVKLF